jgi:glutaredoxin
MSPERARNIKTAPLEVLHMSDDVKVYALSTCIHCRNAKKYLDECGVKYDCVHVDELSGDERKKAVQEIKDHNPAVSFPTILIKDKVIVGYHKDQIDAALKGN